MEDNMAAEEAAVQMLRSLCVGIVGRGVGTFYSYQLTHRIFLPFWKAQ